MAEEDYGPWQGFLATSLNNIAPDNLDPSVEYEIQVRAITEDAVASDWTDSIFFTTPADDVAPPTPSAPVVSSKMGAFTIVWDGHTSSGGTMPLDFERVDIYANGNLVGTQRVAGAEFVWQSAAYGVSYAITFVAIDSGGNSSAASAATTGTVTKVVSTDLGSGSVGGSALLDGSITTIKIGDSQIIAGKIATGAITTTKITDGAISTPKLSTGAVIADKIAANAVTVDKLAAASVTTDKLRVGAASNAIADPNFLSATINALRLGPTKWTVVTGNRAKSSTVVAGERMWLIGDLAYATGTADGVALTANLLPVKEGETYYESVNCFSSTSGFSVSLLTLVYDATGARVGTNFSTATPISGTTAVSTAYTIPSGGCFIAVAIQFSAAGGDAISVWAPKVWQQTSGVLIESGAITADKIAANAIEAGKIKAGAIDGMTISGATISGGLFKSTARTADNDTGKAGWWIQSNGYTNMKDTAGVEFLEFDPALSYFRLGPAGLGNIEMSTTQGQVQVGGQELRIQYPGMAGYLGLYSAANGDPNAIIGNGGLDLSGGNSTITMGTDLHLWSTGTTIVEGGRIEIDANGGNMVASGIGIAQFNVGTRFDVWDGAGTTLIARMATSTFQSQAVYNNTTTGGSPVVVSTSGVIMRGSSSATKYKVDIEEFDHADDAILDLMPKSWIDRSNAERYADLLSKANGDISKIDPEELSYVEPFERIPGLIAEDVSAAGLTEFIRYQDGEIEGLSYDRMWVQLLPTIRRQRDKITDLETRLAALESA